MSAHGRQMISNPWQEIWPRLAEAPLHSSVSNALFRQTARALSRSRVTSGLHVCETVGGERSFRVNTLRRVTLWCWWFCLIPRCTAVKPLFEHVWKSIRTEIQHNSISFLLHSLHRRCLNRIMSDNNDLRFSLKKIDFYSNNARPRGGWCRPFIRN